MINKLNKTIPHLKRKSAIFSALILFCVFLVPFTATIVASSIVRNNVDLSNKKSFDGSVDDESAKFLDQVDRYVGALRSTSGLFTASNFVSQEEFQTFVNSLDIEKALPGAKSIGFVEMVDPNDIDSFVAEIKENGDPNFSIKNPEGYEGELYILKYAEPRELNAKAIGINNASESNRKAAADQARASGKPTVAGNITLVQDDKELPAFVIFYPIYKPGSVLETTLQRQTAFLGWITGATFVDSYFNTILSATKGDLETKVYDGAKVQESKQIFDGRQDTNRKPKYLTSNTVEFLNHEWTFEYSSTKAFENSLDEKSSTKVFIVGFIFSIISLFIAYIFVRRTAVINNQVESKTRELKESENRFSLAVNGAENGVWDWQDITSDDVYWSPQFYVLLGYKDKEIKPSADWFTSNAHPDDLDQSVVAFEKAVENNARWETEYRLKVKSGQYRWFSATGVVSKDDETQKIRMTGSISDINDFVLAKQALEVNEERLTLALEGTNDGIWDWMDIEKDEEFWSPKFYELLGYKEGEIESKASVFYEKLLHPEDAILCGESFQKAIDDVASFDIEYRLKTKSRGYRWFRGSGSVSIDAETNIKRMAGTISDVNELVVTRERLKTNEERLSVAIEGASTGIWDWQDVEQDDIYYSPQFYSMLGYENKEFDSKVSTFFEKIMAPEFTVEVQHAIEKSIEELGPFDVTFKIHKKSGEKRWMHALGKVALDKKTGKKRLSGSISDVTNLNEVQEKLKNNEERLDLAIKGTQVGLFDLFDVTKDEGYLSPQFYEMLGYKVDEFLPTASAFARLLHTDDIEAAMEEVVSAVKNTESFDLEYRLRTKMGSYCWVQAKGIVTRDPKTKIKRITGSITDISERKNVERIKNEFVSVVSHELRTPLTSIRGSLGLVVGTMSDSLPANVSKMLTIAHDNSERLVTIVNDILDIDKIASGKMEFNMEETPLSKIACSAIESTRSLGKKSGISMYTEILDEGVVSNVDADRLIQVVINLLSNAVKFSAEGTSIKVAVSGRNSVARIEVEDFGEGVPVEFRDEIFSKFAQADGSSKRKKGGSGLGLYICKKFVEEMGGAIGFTPKDVGSIFWITLPQIVDEDTQEVTHTNMKIDRSKITAIKNKAETGAESL